MDINTWIVDYKAKFPEFAVILDNEGTDITNTTLTNMIDLGMAMLPQGAISYFSQEDLIKVVDYMVSHLLTYFDVLNSYGQVKSLLRATSSMSASGLSISYVDISRLRGEMFSSLNEFLNTTSYGRVVSVFLNKMAGSCGGYLV